MEFETYKIKLIEKKDSNSFFQLIEKNRPRLENFVAGIVSKTKNRNDTDIFINEMIEKIVNKIYYPYVIIDTSTDEFVGFLDIKNIDWNIPKAEIGYFIDKRHIRKGLARKALNKIVYHFFIDLKFSKLLLRIHSDNIPSIKVAMKCGFDIEGIIRNDYKKSNGEIVDMVYYGKINLII